MKKLLGAALVALGLAAPATANASTVIFFDDFNTNTADQLNGTPAGWNVVNGIADIIGAGGGFDWYPGNGSYLDMDGSRGTLGQDTVLATNALFNLAAGTYKFEFDYGINQNDLAQSAGGDSDFVELGILGILGNGYDADALAHTGSFANSFTNASFTITLGAALNGVRFYIAGLSVGRSDQSGGIIDNFKVTQLSAVPLPGAAILLASGLLGLGGLSRRRRKA